MDTSKLVQHYYALVLAGGAGTRLWPLSRKELPKQMQRFVGGQTLIGATIERLQGVVPINHIYIITTENYASQIRALIPSIIPSSNLIVEPVARGPAAALAFATTIISSFDSEAIIFSFASDHFITKTDQFQRLACTILEYIIQHPDEIALVGIKPTWPDTNLGYIKIRNHSQENSPAIPFEIDHFIEKPDHERARQFIESGTYWWNTAYYCFCAKTLLEAYHDANPQIIDSINAYLRSKNPYDFMQVPDKIQEIEIINPKKYRLVLFPAEFSWKDIGSWKSLHEVLSKLQGKNVVTNGIRHIDINSTNCLIFSTEEKLVATIGLDNIVVVNTPDVLLVLNKDQSHAVKDLVEHLKNQGLSEYL